MTTSNGTERTYLRDECIVFRKTNEKFGGLSNMAPGFPLRVNGIPVRTSEALYQACRFPDHPDVQRLIISQSSPMTAKMKSKPFREDTRVDWQSIRLNVMRWCLRVKLAQNWYKFGQLLLATGRRPIVEESKKDAFWGAKSDGELLKGTNALGRLLMELRDELQEKGEALKQVCPLSISNFRLYSQFIRSIEASEETSEKATANGAGVPTDQNKADKKHLFVSYATEDRIFVEWLCCKLIAEGYYVWWDKLRLLGGESYPGDIDKAITSDAFRVIAVLSRHSVNKPNPLKERTLALNVGRERKENFLIPLNLDALKPTELGWMQSDLTFIPFTDWFSGLSQLLQLLRRSGTPRAKERRSFIAEYLNRQDAVSLGNERLWSNLVELKKIPRTLFRYEHEEAMTEPKARETLREWPHYRENASVCWSYEPPSPGLATRFKFSLRGQCEDWRRATGPDINLFNIGRKVLNAALVHKLLSCGLQQDKETGQIYFPNDLLPERYEYDTPTGQSWVKVSGLRSFRRKDGSACIRYHLAPSLRAALNFFGEDFVQLRIRLHLTELSGQSLPPHLIVSRRKAICRSWWNRQWLSRIYAVLHFLSSGSDRILIGNTQGNPIEVARWPVAFSASCKLDETKLRPVQEALEERSDGDGDAHEEAEEILESES